MSEARVCTNMHQRKSVRCLNNLKLTKGLLLPTSSSKRLNAFSYDMAMSLASIATNKCCELFKCGIVALSVETCNIVPQKYSALDKRNMQIYLD